MLKLLSEDPSNYPDAPREGIRRVLEEVTRVPHPRTALLDTSRIASIRMGEGKSRTIGKPVLIENRRPGAAGVGRGAKLGLARRCRE